MGRSRAKWDEAGNLLRPEYGVWSAMVQRCTNPKGPAWPNYGGRGIRVCDRWLKAENFFDDMGARPSPTHSLDRINNDGNYEPSNCRWATRSEQMLNRRNRHVIVAAGRALSLSEWSKEKGWPDSVIHKRLLRGWSPERAVSEPLNDKSRAGLSRALSTLRLMRARKLAL